MKNSKRIVALCIAAVMLFSVGVQAGSTQSFSRWETKGDDVTVYSRPLYEAKSVITGASLGVEKMEGITDLYCSPDGLTYVLCGGISKLYVLNKDYTLKKELTVTDENGTVDFTDAEGIHVDSDGNLYLCNTAYGKVLQLSKSGKVLREITCPDSSIIPEDFIFQPVSMVRDTDGNHYVLSLGSYYGAALFNSKWEFVGFYGANTVQHTALDALEYLWDLLTNTDAKRAQKIQKLPYAFASIAVDSKGYIYTASGSNQYSSDNGEGQIQMLSPGGTSILKKRELTGDSSDAASYNFLEPKVVTTWHERRLQDFVSLRINDRGYIMALDSTYGLVYVFDTDCNLLGAFGGGIGEGDQLGEFETPVAMSLNGDQVIVADSKACTLTVFDITEYGALLQSAQSRYMKGDYLEAEEDWKTILSMDSNCRFAYRALGKAAYTKGDYELAMEYSEKAMDYSNYDTSYRKVRDADLQKNFTFVFLGIVVVIIAAVLFLLYMKKREEPLIKNDKLHTMLTSPLHPFHNFNDVKYRGKGSMLYAVILLVLYTFTSILRITGSSFLFRAADVYSYNSLFTLATTAGLIILWSVSNWLTSTLMDGKGRMNEIFIVTCYSLIPMIIYNVVYTVLSYFMSYNDSALLSGLSTVVIIYTLFLVSVAVMTVHDYSFGKFLLTTFITVFLMIFVVFIIFMIVVLVQQLGNFIYSIYMEVAYR